jgi:hypothetical protein
MVQQGRRTILLIVILLFVCGGFIHGQSQPVGARWIYTYNHAANYLDEAKAVIYGDDGNIYSVGGVKGFSLESYDVFTVISLDSDGNERWQYFYNKSNNIAHECAYDVVYGYNNIYAAGVTRYIACLPCTTFQIFGNFGGSFRPTGIPLSRTYFTVINLDTDGDEQWVYKHPRGCALSVDYGLYDGNIYAAGYKMGKYGCKLLVISLDPNGNERWVYTYEDGDGFAKEIVYGEDGNLYIVGQCIGDDWTYDFTVISLDSDGNERWVYQCDGDGYELDFYDTGRAIIYGIDNNIYAAGRLVENNGLDFTVISLTTSGNERWVYQYNGPGQYWDDAYDIDCDDNANLYVAGTSSDTLDGHWENVFTVISLTNSGNKKWVYKRFGAYPGTENQANSIVYGEDDKVYAAGKASFDSNTFYYDFTAIALTNAGGEVWTYNFDGTACSADEAFSIDYGADGYLYVAGYNIDQNTSRDYTVISLPQYYFPPVPPDTSAPFFQPK